MHLRAGRGGARASSKAPAAKVGSAAARRNAARWAEANTVSACRKARRPPRAARAPAFIWPPRPRGARRRWTWGWRAATSQVSSALPPSTRMISRSEAAGSRARVEARSGASFNTGKMMDMRGFIGSMRSLPENNTLRQNFRLES